MKLGLRFDRGDAPLLRSLAAQIKNGEIRGHAADVFEQAALAAEHREPLQVHCDDPMEVVQMATLYMRFGVARPVIEELSGTH